jgi:hypothetical protein
MVISVIRHIYNYFGDAEGVQAAIIAEKETFISTQ